MKSNNPNNHQAAVKWILVFTVAATIGWTGCEPQGVRYYTAEELLSLEKFHGYEYCDYEYWTSETNEYKPCKLPMIEGPWRVVPGVNFTVRREVMKPLIRELEFDGKTWRFKHEDSVAYGFRLLALGNEKGEKFPLLIKTKETLPSFYELNPDLPEAKAYAERQRREEEQDGKDKEQEKPSGDTDKPADEGKSDKDSSGK